MGTAVSAMRVEQCLRGLLCGGGHALAFDGGGGFQGVLYPQPLPRRTGSEIWKQRLLGGKHAT